MTWIRLVITMYDEDSTALPDESSEQCKLHQKVTKTVHKVTVYQWF